MVFSAIRCYTFTITPSHRHARTHTHSRSYHRYQQRLVKHSSTSPTCHSPPLSGCLAFQDHPLCGGFSAVSSPSPRTPLLTQQEAVGVGSGPALTRPQSASQSGRLGRWWWWWWWWDDCCPETMVSGRLHNGAL